MRRSVCVTVQSFGVAAELEASSEQLLKHLRYIQLLYEIESEIRDLEPDLRRRIRQEQAVPVMDSCTPR